MPKGTPGVSKSTEQKRKQSESVKGKVPWNKGVHGLMIAWNKGRTKETDARLADMGKRAHHAYLDGTRVPGMLGKTQSITQKCYARRKKSRTTRRKMKLAHQRQALNPDWIRRQRVGSRRRSRKKSWRLNNQLATALSNKRLSKRAKCSRTLRKSYALGLVRLHSPRYKGLRFGGTWFRSSWEVALARWLRKHLIHYQYEPVRFILRSGSYHPDFYLPDYDLFIEVKGYLGKPNYLLRARELVRKYRVRICILMRQHLKALRVL